MKLPDLIQLAREGGTFHLLIDGEEFPWAVAEHGVAIENIGRNSMPSVSLTLLAHRVEVYDDHRHPVSEEERP